LKQLLTILFLASFLFAKLDFKSKAYIITDIKKEQVVIKNSDLRKGQSGVIISSGNNIPVIIATATVTKIDGDNVLVKYKSEPLLDQNSIPTSKLTPKDGDIFLANHLYKTSVMIVPNFEAKQLLIKHFPDQNFINEDFLASNLKLEKEPLPKKETIRKFCQKHQVGTIFLIASDKLFILDANSFDVLEIQYFATKDKTIKVPFFSKIDDIERGFWNFGDEKIKDYNKYYLKMIGL